MSSEDDSPHDAAACPLCCGAKRVTGAARRVAPAVVRPALVYLAIWILLVWVGVIGWRRQVDPLSDPASVATWTTSSVVLADGRSVPLPGIKRITGAPHILDRLVARGVEVQSDGRVATLVRVYSGCGNCTSFAEKRLKYDLSALLVFLEQAEPDASIRRGRDGDPFARRRLEDADGWEWGLTELGGGRADLDALCERSGIPLARHVEPSIAFPW